MELTSTELGQKLGIKRNSVVMRMNKIPHFRQKYTRRKGHSLLISPQGAKLIAGEGNKKSKRSVKWQSKVTTSSQESGKQVKDIKMLKDLLHKEESNHRQDKASMRKVIESYQRSQSHLEKLLDQQQQLQLATQKENTDLKSNVKQLKNSLDHLPKLPQQSPKQPKSGFWKRLFGKK